MDNKQRRIYFVVFLSIAIIILYGTIISILNPDIFRILKDFSNAQVISLLSGISIMFVSFLFFPKLSTNFKEIDETAKNSSKTIDEVELAHIENNENKRTFILVNRSIMDVVNQMNIAESKASGLLDNGKVMIWAGITYYFFVILCWQVFFLFKNSIAISHIIGMVECTGIFIFIEIIAAWYLKQYRYYVDRLNYLIKIKMMFDKYLFSYSLIEENNLKDEYFEKILNYFSSEIVWPDDKHMHKNKDDDIHESLLNTIKELSRTVQSISKSK